MPDQHDFTALMVVGAVLSTGSCVPVFLARERSQRLFLGVAALSTQLVWWWLVGDGVRSVNFSDSGGLGLNIFGGILLQSTAVPLLLPLLAFTAIGVAMGVDRAYERSRSRPAPLLLLVASLAVVLIPPVLWFQTGALSELLLPFS